MANTYNTAALPLGTTDVKALYNNASNIDEAANSPSPAWTDRFGKRRQTWSGIEARFDQFLVSSGWVFTSPVSYQAGIVLSLPNQIFERSGEYYRAAPGVTLPYTTTGVWASEQSNFIGVGDALLRSELADTIDLAKGAAMLGRAVQVISSIQDLPNLPIGPSQTAFALGHTDELDGGGGNYRYNAASVATDNDGSVKESTFGGAWELITTDGTVTLKQFGVKFDDGVTNNQARIQAAITSHNDIWVNEGTAGCIGGVHNTNKHLRITGPGEGLANIKWTAALSGEAGINHVSSSGLAGTSRFSLIVEGVSLLAGVAGCGTAISANFTIGAGGFVYTGIDSVFFRDMCIRGDDYFNAGAHYWTTGIYLKNSGSVNIDSLNMLGKQNIAGTKGVQIEATNGPNTSFFIKGLKITWWDRGVDIYNNTGGSYTVEGCYISLFELVGCNYGVYVRGGPVHALRLGIGHINADKGAVIYDATARNSTTFAATNVYAQLGNLWSGSYQEGSVYALDRVHYSQITGGYVACKPSPFTVTQNGIAFLSSNGCRASSVTFVDISNRPVIIGTNGVDGECDKTGGGDCSFINCANPPLVSGTTNGFEFLLISANGYKDDANGLREVWGSVDVALNGSGDGTLTLPVPFRNGYMCGVVCNGNPAIAGTGVFSIFHASCTSSTLEIHVSGVTSITVRVNFRAQGY